MDRSSPTPSQSPRSISRTRWRHVWIPALFVLIGLVWGSLATGMVSSNDGSHIALSRALALRNTPQLGEDAALTLRVDLARKDGALYSDRPPGTALLAMPAIWIGDALDTTMRPGANHQALQPPASPPFAYTYRVRAPNAPSLLDRVGTGIAASVHVGGLGILALALLWMRLRARGVGRSAVVFAISALSLASLMGPYASIMFCHVPAIFAICLADWSGARLVDTVGDGDGDRGRVDAVIFGAAGGLAILTDYLLAIPVAGLMFGRCRRVQIGWTALGAAGALAVGAWYHTAAFGSPWSIGYDHQVNFAFARSRGATFSGNPLDGAQALWGAGDGGVLGHAPLWIVALGVFAWPHPGAETSARQRVERAGWWCWMFALACHQTPTGGAFVDHRYLLPVMPVLAAAAATRLDGLTGRWRRQGWLLAWILWISSALGVWPYAIKMREQPLMTGRVTMWALAGVGLLAGLLLVRWERRRDAGTRPSTAVQRESGARDAPT